MHTLERATLVNAPIEEVFSFFDNPRNLAKMTPTGMGFKITHIDEMPIKPGFRIAYTIRIMGVPIKWVTRIPVYEPPRRLVDIQAKGPYKVWRHEHTFDDLGGQTLMRDRVRYELPFGILGDVVHALFVKRQLREIFDYRGRKIHELFAKQTAAP